MFTGIIEETGKIKALSQSEANLELRIQASKVLDGISHGASIAHNGVCLTVTDFDQAANEYSVTAIDETLKLTNLGDLAQGSLVNLERCLRASDRLDGHIVQGHVDATAELLELNDQDGSTEFVFSLPQDIAKYVVYKGSIAVNGISLTVSSCEQDRFAVCIIPTTLEITNFSELKVGDRVNIETDIVARYIEKLNS